MNMNHRLTAIVLAIFSPAAMAQTSKLQSVLDQLDAASAHFKSAQASVKYDNYTRVVRADEIQTGTMYVERSGSADRMGAVFFDQGAKAPKSVINYDGGILQLYTPGTNQVDVFKAGDNQAKYESFLTLGFGGSGKALKQAWDITDQGTEMLSDGTRQVSTEKLDLVSKDPSVQSTFKHVTIWVDPSRGISLKQKFFAPDGDTRTADYMDIKLNATVDTKAYAISKKANRISH